MSETLLDYVPDPRHVEQAARLLETLRPGAVRIFDDCIVIRRRNAWRVWNCAEDTIDAMNLAIVLGLRLSTRVNERFAGCQTSEDAEVRLRVLVPYAPWPEDALRRAITFVAAELWRRMQ